MFVIQWPLSSVLYLQIVNSICILYTFEKNRQPVCENQLPFLFQEKAKLCKHVLVLTSDSENDLVFFFSFCRYDFFLVSQHVRQGTVTPTHYIIVDDKTNLKPDHLQR